MSRIVVTGATGFIGRRLVPLLRERGHEVVEAGRRPGGHGAAFVDVGEIGAATRWDEALAGADAVVHLAGLAHRDTSENVDQDLYFEINERGTARLAEAAAQAGVGCFVLVSTIFAKFAEARPSAYARSKLAAEEHVRRLASEAMSAIVLRPSLVYAHDAAANWHRLQKLAVSGLPLPFGSVANRRALCAVANLCEAIAVAVEAGLREKVSGTFEVADEKLVSLAQILTWLRRGMGLPPRLVPVPPALLRLAGTATGKSALVATLLDDQIVDVSEFSRRFGWKPPVASEIGIAESGRLFKAGRAAS